MAMIGQAINLYLDADGGLVITQEKRPELRALDASMGFTLDAPLDGAVRATVEMYVSHVDVTIPRDQLKAIAVCPSCGSRKDSQLKTAEPN